MLDGKDLGNHAAHRRTHDVCFVDAEMIKQPNNVCCHVAQRVGHRRHRLLEQCCGDHGTWVDNDSIEFGRQAHIAIVEAHHEVTAISEHVDEVFVPSNHLCPEAHDEDKCRIISVTEGVVLEFNRQGFTVVNNGSWHVFTVAFRRVASRTRARACQPDWRPHRLHRWLGVAHGHRPPHHDCVRAQRRCICH